MAPQVWDYVTTAASCGRDDGGARGTGAGGGGDAWACRPAMGRRAWPAAPIFLSPPLPPPRLPRVEGGGDRTRSTLPPPPHRRALIHDSGVTAAGCLTGGGEHREPRGRPLLATVSLWRQRRRRWGRWRRRRSFCMRCWPSSAPATAASHAVPAASVDVRRGAETGWPLPGVRGGRPFPLGQTRWCEASLRGGTGKNRGEWGCVPYATRGAV